MKNAVMFQRNIDLFANVIRGHLQLVSVPPNVKPEVTLDPGSFAFDLAKFKVSRDLR